MGTPGVDLLCKMGRRSPLAGSAGLQWGHVSAGKLHRTQLSLTCPWANICMATLGDQGWSWLPGLENHQPSSESTIWIHRDVTGPSLSKQNYRGSGGAGGDHPEKTSEVEITSQDKFRGAEQRGFSGLNEMDGAFSHCHVPLPWLLLSSLFRFFFFSFVNSKTILILSAFFLIHHFLPDNKTLLGSCIYENIWSYLHSDS